MIFRGEGLPPALRVALCVETCRAGGPAPGRDQLLERAPSPGASRCLHGVAFLSALGQRSVTRSASARGPLVFEDHLCLLSPLFLQSNVFSYFSCYGSVGASLPRSTACGWIRGSARELGCLWRGVQGFLPLRGGGASASRRLRRRCGRGRPEPFSREPATPSSPSLSLHI